MSDEALASDSTNSELFKAVKFYIAGDVPDQVTYQIFF